MRAHGLRRPAALGLGLRLLGALLLGSLAPRGSVAAALPQGQLFPFGEARGDRILPAGDDETSAPLPLASPLLFYESRFDHLYVSPGDRIRTGFREGGRENCLGGGYNSHHPLAGWEL